MAADAPPEPGFVDGAVEFKGGFVKKWKKSWVVVKVGLMQYFDTDKFPGVRQRLVAWSVWPSAPRQRRRAESGVFETSFYARCVRVGSPWRCCERCVSVVVFLVGAGRRTRAYRASVFAPWRIADNEASLWRRRRHKPRWTQCVCAAANCARLTRRRRSARTRSFSRCPRTRRSSLS